MELHIEQSGERHQFNLRISKEKNYRRCGLCEEKIAYGNAAYGCRRCDYWLHESCGKVPPPIVHPFHPKHPLLLVSESKGPYTCDACGKSDTNSSFHCSKCDFDLDLDCASLTVISTSEISKGELVSSSTHPHPLSLCTTKNNKLVHRPCSYCYLSIEGSSVYVCVQCQLFLHPTCAELPMEIKNHPFHPQHSLFLKHFHDYHSFECSSCGISSMSAAFYPSEASGRSFGFQCSECEFILDIRCASLTVLATPTTTPIATKTSKDESSHSNPHPHPHPLFLCTPKHLKLSRLRCLCCQLYIEDPSICVCIECHLLMHPKCAEFPLELKNHPFHPQHPLFFHRNHSSIQCSVCRRQHMMLGFKCSKCDFNLGIQCASLIVLATPKTTIEIYEDDGSQILQLPNNNRHPHPMFLCTMGNALFDLKCSYCCKSIEGSSFYVCIECQFFLHPICAKMPIEIKNLLFHPQHPLFLCESLARSCSACGEDLLDYSFCCTICEYTGFHVTCASLMPARILPQSCSGRAQIQQQLRHPHPLTLIDNKKNYPFSCYICRKPFEYGEEDDLSSIYACLECKILLHKSCADLPRKIAHHPFDPQHVLELIDKPDYAKRCCVCDRRQLGSYYLCQTCGYIAAAACAWPIPRTMKFRFHKHPLIVIDIKNCSGKDTCNKCHESCTLPFFSCGECIRYNLHPSCSPVLPLTIKHQDHKHLLTLSASRVVDQDEDVEFYCDSCKETITLSDQSYSCTKCLNYDAHVECVSSAIVLTLLKEEVACEDEDGTLDLSSKVIEENTDKRLALDNEVMANEDSSQVASKNLERQE